MIEASVCHDSSRMYEWMNRMIYFMHLLYRTRLMNKYTAQAEQLRRIKKEKKIIWGRTFLLFFFGGKNNFIDRKLIVFFINTG